MGFVNKETCIVYNNNKISFMKKKNAHLNDDKQYRWINNATKVHILVARTIIKVMHKSLDTHW
jgi:hypothetical protein